VQVGLKIIIIITVIEIVLHLISGIPRERPTVTSGETSYTSEIKTDLIGVESGNLAMS